MNPRLNFICGIVLVAIALTLAVAIGSRSTDETPPTKSFAFAEPSERTSARTPATRHGPSETGSRPGAWSPESSGRTADRSRERWRIEIDPSHPEPAELAAQARQVKRYADGRLANLTSKLGLDPAQEQRILPLLARSSQSYDPAMRIVASGSAAEPAAGDSPLDGGEAARLIGEELQPEQRSAWIEDSLDDMLLWQEIIDNLTRRLDQLPPEGESPTVPENSDPPPAPSSGGGRNLFK